MYRRKQAELEIDQLQHSLALVNKDVQQLPRLQDGQTAKLQQVPEHASLRLCSEPVGAAGQQPGTSGVLFIRCGARLSRIAEPCCSAARERQLTTTGAELHACCWG